MKHHHAWFLALTGSATLLFGVLVGFFPVHNSDVWWHMAWGNAMLAQHTLFPTVSSFYFTPTSTAYLHELPNAFLGNIGLALLYHYGGTIALQLLVLACLFLGGAGVILIPLKQVIFEEKNKNLAILALLLFFGFCLGTSQLHIVRNSLASLALFPAALGLYSWHCRRARWLPLLFYPFLFIIWSWIHPSYVLGMISLLLLYGGLFIEKNFRLPALPLISKLSVSHIAITFVLLLFIFASSLTYSSQVQGLYTTFSAHISEVIKSTKQPSSPALAEKPSITQQLLQAVSKPIWGNNTLPLSGDFIPTWQVMAHPAAWSSMLLSCIALGLLLISRASNRLGMVALLFLTTYFGLCYMRGTGYAAIAATFVISSTLANLVFIRSQKSFLFKQPIFILSLILALSALIGVIRLIVLEKNEAFFMEKGRIFGVGKIAAFDNVAYDFVKTHFPDVPCFTTMVTGSYASFLWKNEKKVFIDSFFAPHSNELWGDYRMATTSHDSTFLDPYGVQLAIIENSRSDWSFLFLTSQAWRPLAISLGTTVYAKQGNLSATDMPVELLFTKAEVEQCHSPTTRRAVAAAYYNTILSLQLHQMGAIAENLINQNEALFEQLVNDLPPAQQGNIKQQPRSIAPILLTP